MTSRNRTYDAPPRPSSGVISIARMQLVRRIVVVFFLILLPLQLTWAAAAAYCAHEPSTAAADHFGHHEHQHVAGSASAFKMGDSTAGDLDCNACHFGCTAWPASFIADISMVLPEGLHRDEARPYRSHIPPGLDRPDRAPRATAARLRGGVVVELLST